MIVKLAAITSGMKKAIVNSANHLGFDSLSKKLAKNPHLVDSIKNAALVGTIATGDGFVKMWDRKPGESKIKSFGRGALEGAFAGSLIAGADQGIDMIRNHGEKNLSWFARHFS